MRIGNHCVAPEDVFLAIVAVLVLLAILMFVVGLGAWGLYCLVGDLDTARYQHLCVSGTA